MQHPHNYKCFQESQCFLKLAIALVHYTASQTMGIAHNTQVYWHAYDGLVQLYTQRSGWHKTISYNSSINIAM